MAAVYYLGCKSVSTKKGDRIVAYLLCHDSYHSPRFVISGLKKIQILRMLCSN